MEPYTITDTQRCGRMKISAVTRRVLPALRLYSSRMMVDAAALFGIEGSSWITSLTKEMWREYAHTLTMLSCLFPLSEAIDLDYMLGEDECTLGLSPFRHESTKSRYYLKDGVSLKLRKYDDPSTPQGRHNTEMLQRVSDLLTDSLAMQNKKVQPCNLLILIGY